MAWLTVVGAAAYLAKEAFTPDRGEPLLGYENPFGITGAPGLVRSFPSGAFCAELLAVVDRTVQPAGMSLWLRPGSGRP